MDWPPRLLIACVPKAESGFGRDSATTGASHRLIILLCCCLFNMPAFHPETYREIYIALMSGMFDSHGTM